MLLGFLIVLWSLHCAYAQNTSVSCSSTYDWMRNSKGQSPCLIAAWLQYSCIGAYEVGPPIYLGPTNGTAQPWAGLGGIPPWPSFSQHCPSVAAQQYPEAIPNGTLIPSWAYLPLLNNTFDVKAAQYIASLDGPATDTTSTMPSEPPQLSQFTSAPLSTSLASSASASPSDTAQQARSHHMEGSALAGVIVVCMLGWSVIIAGIVVVARRKWLPTRTPQTSALRMPAARMPAFRMPVLRMPVLPRRMPTLQVPVCKFRMPAVRVPSWRKRGFDSGSEASWTVGGATKHDLFYDPNDPRTFPPSPTPADIYFYRCRQKAAAQALASDRSDTDVTIGGVPTSTVSSTLSSYPTPTSPLRGYNWRPEGGV